MSRVARCTGSTSRAKRHAAVPTGLAAYLALAILRVASAGATTPVALVSAAHHAAPAPARASADPIIYSVSASPTVAHAGDSIKWDAHVSPNVVAVTARVAVYSFSLYRERFGHFGETFVIPKDVPPFFRGRYGVTITATTATGASTSRLIRLSFE